MTLIRRFNNGVRANNQALNHLFNNDYLLDPTHFFGTSPQQHSVNIKETDEAFHIEMATPGFKKDDFQVEIEKNILTIKADHQEESETKDDYYKKEFSASSFEKSFKLPDNKFDDTQIEAKYDAGILYVTINKKEEAKPKPKRSIAIA